MDLMCYRTGERLREATLREAVRSIASGPEGVFRLSGVKDVGPATVYVDGVEPEEALMLIGVHIADHMPDSAGVWWLQASRGTAEVQVTLSGEACSWGEFIECVFDLFDMQGDLEQWRGWEVIVADVDRPY